MVDGKVRNLGAHFERLGLDLEQQQMVRTQLREAATGASNPLVRADGQVQHRPDRPFSALIGVDPIPHLDLRTQPTRKGPDLVWLTTRLRQSERRGFAEGLLSQDGLVVEGIFSALICFDSGVAEFCTHPRTLNSTTLPPVLEFLRSSGLVVRPCSGWRSPKRLWLLNAFSGVRSAGGPDPTSVNRWLWDHADVV
ncbi:aminotransferase class IV [Corynebacterium epidermidicanis]|nr:hypothetical protein [Corynebacterium epidermidicanis]